MILVVDHCRLRIVNRAARRNALDLEKLLVKTRYVLSDHKLIFTVLDDKPDHAGNRLCRVLVKRAGIFKLKSQAGHAVRDVGNILLATACGHDGRAHRCIVFLGCHEAYPFTVDVVHLSARLLMAASYNGPLSARGSGFGP